jgi:hypothetical protein
MIQAGPATHQGDGRSKFAPVWEDPRTKPLVLPGAEPKPAAKQP